MFKKIILLSSISASLVACSGSGESPTAITADNASNVSKAVLQQVTGVAKQAQMAGSKKSTASSKSTANAGITIVQSLTILDISFLTEATPSCANSGQDNMRYVVNSDITLNCDFVVKASSQLEINDAVFSITGNLTLLNLIVTGNSGITATNGDVSSTGQILISGNFEFNLSNSNLSVTDPTNNNNIIISAAGLGSSSTINLQATQTNNSINQSGIVELLSTLILCGTTTPSKSQPQAGITIEQGLTGLDVYYADCPKTESSSESSGTGITIAQSISDLLITLCLNTDGTADFNYDDSNSNSILDLGEVSHANYNNCQFTESLSFDGKQSTTVTEFFPSYKSTVSNNNYSITENGKTSTSNGSVSLSASDTNGVQNFRSEFNEFSEATGIETTTLHSGYIETSFSNSSYEMTQDTVISGSSFSGKLAIKTDPNLKGSMLKGELLTPSSGKLKATAEDGSYIIIDADDGDNNTDTFNLTVSNGATLTSVQKWSEL